MAERYALNYGWMSHPLYTEGVRLTLRAQILASHESSGSPDAVHEAVNRWLGSSFAPGWMVVDGQPRMVAYRGGGFVDVQAATDPAAVGPDLLLSSSGEDACESVTDLADRLYDVVREADPRAELVWEELPPSPLGHR